MDGHQGQGHTQGIDGIDVSFTRSSWCVQLVSIKTSIKSTLLARPTAVDVFPRYAIIVLCLG